MDLSSYRLIGFDADKTLVETLSGKAFREHARDWRIMVGRVAKIRELREQAFSLFMASNQGGVAFGYMAEADILRELHATARVLLIPEQAVYVCYTHPKAIIERYRIADDQRRKPGPGMLLEAMNLYSIQPHETLFVGDRPEDEEAARNAGCAFAWAHEFFGED